MPDAMLEFEGFSAAWRGRKVVGDVHWTVPRRSLCALVGPSGVGKSTLLRAAARLNDGLPGWRTEGQLRVAGVPCADFAPAELRRRVGYLSQKPVVFPRSILDNAVFGLRYTGRAAGARLADSGERALKSARLWDEVKDRLGESALGLSVGQQQRLCLARALAVEPQALLLDEPTASLDAVSQSAVEETLRELKTRLAIILVTHSVGQARRLADSIAYLHPDEGTGRLVETGPAAQVLDRPADLRLCGFLAAAGEPSDNGRNPMERRIK